jgi:hypothetical protein
LGRRSGEPTAFAVEGYELTNEEEGGETARQAGVLPFEQRASITVNEGVEGDEVETMGKGVG